MPAFVHRAVPLIDDAWAFHGAPAGCRGWVTFWRMRACKAWAENECGLGRRKKISSWGLALTEGYVFVEGGPR